MKNRKNKTTTKTKQIITTTTKTPKENHKDENNNNKNKKQTKIKNKKETHSIFPNDFSHAVYLLPHQKTFEHNPFMLLKLCYLLNAIFF